MEYSHKTSKVINNYITFQVAWFAAAYWHDYRSILVSVACLIWLYLCEPWSKIRIIHTLQLAVLGIIVDSLLTMASIYQFDNTTLVLPYWLVVLWFVFACSLTMSMLPLLKHLSISIVAGAIFGPLAYWAGAKFGALQVDFTWIHLLGAMIIWGLFMGSASTIVRQRPNTNQSMVGNPK